MTLVVLGPLTVFSQSMTLSSPMSLVTGSLSVLGNTGELEADWGVVNTTSASISVKARREIISEVSGSSNYFCWGVCYDSSTTVSVVNQTIQAGDTNYTFYAHYRPLGNVGLTVIKYVFYLSTNSSDLVNQTVGFCVDTDCTIGIEESHNQASLFWNASNPFEGFGAMNYQLANGQNRGTLTVMNVAGQVVKDVHLYNAKGQVFFDAQDFSSGMYLFQLKSNGELLGTQKIMVK